MGLYYLLCVALLISVSFGAPSPSNNECKGPNDETVLGTKTYKYRYHGEATAKAVGTTDLEEKIDIRCEVHVEHTSQCLYTMEVKDCHLNAFEVNGQGNKVDHFVQDQSLDDVTRYLVSFALNDGEIKSFYVSDQDPLYSVNIKRGIASAFVRRKSDFKADSKSRQVRTDVQGVCPVDISSPEEGKSVEKKDMGGCHLPSRKDYRLSPLSMFFNMSFIQHVINSSVDCQVSLDNDKEAIQSLKCQERHAIRLDSSHNTDAAVQTVVEYEMELVDSSKEGPSMDETEDLSAFKNVGIVLEYEENSNSFHHDHADLTREIKKLLAEIATTNSERIHVDTIRQHRELVGLLRSSQEPLNDISRSVIDCNFQSSCTDTEKSVIMDLYQFSLLQCNTVPCLNAFADLVDKKLVGKAAVNFAYMTLTNIRNTPPEYVGAVLKMCIATTDRLCYHALGAIVWNIDEEQGYVDRNSVAHKDLLDVARHLTATLGDDCSLEKAKFPPSINSHQKLDYMMTVIRTIGNIGLVFGMADPEILNRLPRCVRNTELSSAARVAAVEAYRKIIPRADTGSDLLRFFLEEEMPVEIRIAAYNVLVSNFDASFYSEVFVRLITDKNANSQVRGYLATELIAAKSRKYKEMAEEGKRQKRSLPASMADVPALAQLDLSTIPVFEVSSSRKQAVEDYVDLPFLPEGFQRFGGRVEGEVIFNTLSAFPQAIRGNLTTEVFGKAFQFLEVALQSGGFENVISQIKTMILTLKDPSYVQYLTLIKQTLSNSRATARRRPSGAFEPKTKILLDKQIEESIKQLRDAYKAAQKTLPPFFVLSLKMLGNDLGFLSYEDVIGAINKLYASVSAGPRKNDDHQVFKAESTRVLDFIEAYHQFPTLMGIPLNWTTNASVAYSFRTSLRTSSQSASLPIHLSGAMTCLNRMVLDLPTVTAIGVQANTSAYTDNDLKINLALARAMGAKISLEVDDKLHKPLELYRTNQIIKGSRHVDIEDHDVERETREVCSSAEAQKLTGYKFCLFRSFADVSRSASVKPFFLMAGSAKMTVHVQKIDPEIDSVNTDISYESNKKSPEKKLNIKLSATGPSGEKRSLPVEIKANTDTREFWLRASHSDLPDAYLHVNREKIEDTDKVQGYKSSVKFAVQKGRDFELTYEKHRRQEEREDVPSNRNLSGKKEKFVSKVDERQVKFRTPYNLYRYHSQLHNNIDHDKVDIHLSYENLDPSLDWMSKVLPKIFYESDRKAHIRLHGNYRHPQRSGKGGVSRQATSHLVIPYSTIELSTHTVEDKDRLKFRLNITKTEKATGHLLSFLNVTSKYVRKSSSELDRVVGEAQVDIPRHSLSAKAIGENHRNGAETLVHVEVTGSRAVPKDNEDGHFQGLYNYYKDQGKEFERYEKKIVYEQKIKQRKGTDDDLTDTVKSAMNSDIPAEAEYQGAFSESLNKVVTADIRLSYPSLLTKKQEQLDFNGTFKNIVTNSGAHYTFGKDFVLESSQAHLRLTSTSGFVRLDKRRTSLLHSSYFTNTAKGTNQGNYNLKLQAGRTSKNCPIVKFNHKIDAHWLQFSSNINVDCKNGDPRELQATIDVDNHSPYLKELELHLKQTFNFGSDGGESMNLTSSFYDISVRGKYDLDRSFFEKRAKFTRKVTYLPSFKIDVEGDPKGSMKAELVPIDGEGKLSKFTITRDIENDGTVLHYKVSHTHKDTGAEHQDLDVKLQIAAPHVIIVSGKGSVGVLPHLAKSARTRLEAIAEHIRDKIENPDNELNRQLAPYLEAPSIRDFIDKKSNELSEEVDKLLHRLLEAADKLAILYKPSVDILMNSAVHLVDVAQKTLDCLKETYTGRFIENLAIPQRLRYLVLNYEDISEKMAKKLLGHVIDKDDSYRFGFEVHHPLILTSFLKLPKLETSSAEVTYPLLNRLVSLILDMSRLHRMPQMRIDEKIGMIFGSSSVLTFDGKLYRVPEYPSEDCAFLLAHDVRGKTFSLLTTKNKIHAIFPEMSVTIDQHGKVYANSTPSDTSKPLNLPLVSLNNRISVTREDSDSVIITSPTLRVHCRLNSCVVLLTSLHHAGTIGLLGNADGETDNDFVTPKGDRLSDPKDMALTYELSKQQICTRLYNAPDPMFSPDVKETCVKRLEDAKLEDCSRLTKLNQLDVTMSCAYDYAYNPGNNKATCSTIDAMVFLCSYHNIKGHGCAHCDGANTKEDEKGFTKRVDKPALDLVLIVEENKDTLKAGSSTALKGVESLVKDIVSALETENFGEAADHPNRLFVVGFGGKAGVEHDPHLQTLGGEPSLEIGDVTNALKTLKFDGTKRGNVLAAVDYAKDAIKFRPTASKVFLLITHEDQEVSHIDRPLLYPLQKELNTNGITLYSFSDFPALKRSKKVLGLRADGLILPSSGQDYLDYPKTLIAKLTSATRGAIYASSYVEENNSDIFFHTVGEEVVSKVGKEKRLCKKCRCTRNFLYNLRSECHPKDC